jgi:hypothetical protein
MNRLRKLLLPACAAVVFGFGLGLFFLRSPVLVVTDAPFEGLYGTRRSLEKRLAASLRMFRRVKPVLIAESAGADLIAFAVEGAAKNPHGVLFPYRYRYGAERYRNQFPRVPVAVLGGGIRKEGIPGFFGTDTPTDFYRAGRCAALFGPAGTIHVFRDDPVSEEDRRAFRIGLREEGYERDPVYGTFSDLFLPGNISCVVLSGVSAFEETAKIPMVLFSWVDPALTPGNIWLVFDDSPWALAVKAVEMLDRGDTAGTIPSEILVLGERIPEKRILRGVKRAIRDNLTEKE